MNRMLRRSLPLCVLVLCSLAFFSTFPDRAAAQDSASETPPRFKIDAPELALQDVPLPNSQPVRITALTPEGKVDETFRGPVEIEGVKITEFGKEVPPGEWKNGVLELRSDLSAGRAVTLEASTIQVTAGEETASHPTRRVWKWWSLLPPLVAIFLAVWLKEVIVALLAGVLAGAIVLADGNPLVAFLRTIDTHLVEQLVPADGSLDRVRTVMFTMLLGGMIGIMSASGGTRALVDRLTVYAKTREHGQVMTWLLGLVVFFDDYANSLLVGSTMRSVSDRLRISREKLAFLVDSTSAPVAGLAFSTWVGFELSQISPALEQLGVEAEVGRVFLATLPYRFYPILLLVFVGMVAWTGRDFGAMRVREAEVALDPHPPETLETQAEMSGDLPQGPAVIFNALVPLCVLLFVLLFGIFWELSHGREPNSYQVLLHSAFSATLTAGLMAVAQGALTLAKIVSAGIKGMQNMLMAVVILVLAWSIASLCDDGHLNTAGFIIDSLGRELSARWMPATAFVVASAVSFATGSSFATMGLLMPLFITLTFYLMTGEGGSASEFAFHPYALGTIGAVLAGAIWGDHCSPISDTTVLSSAASGCDHLSHVATQLPYAMTVGLVSLLVGYVPIGFGLSPYITLPASLVLLAGVLRAIGRRPPEAASSSS